METASPTRKVVRFDVDVSPTSSSVVLEVGECTESIHIDMISPPKPVYSDYEEADVNDDDEEEGM
jgi:hypothetical protein